MPRHLPRAIPLAAALALAAGLIGPPPALANVPAGKLYEDALSRYERQDVSGAIVQLKNALQQDPKLLAAYVLLGKALLAQGDAVGAEEACPGRSASAWTGRRSRSLSGSAVRPGKYQAVARTLPPDAVSARTRAAAAVARAGVPRARRHESAQAAFQDALAVDRRFVPALLALADLSMRQGKASDAAKLADEAVAVAPEDPRVWHFKGTLAQGRGDLRAALESYSKALALNERLLEPRVARASLLMDLGQLDEAGRDVDALKRLHPRQPRALDVRALYASKRGDEAVTRDTLAELTRTIDPAPRDLLRRSAPELLLIGGLAHHGLKQYEKATSYLTDYLAVDPGHVGARKLLASMTLAQGDVRDAIALLEPARKAAPKDPQVLTLLASAHMARREYALASGYLEDALKLSGGAVEVESTVGMNSSRAARPTRAPAPPARVREGPGHPGRTRARDEPAAAGNAKAAVATAEKVAARAQEPSP
jgi:tetratricopeptide (TPR) repeat protein